MPTPKLFSQGQQVLYEPDLMQILALISELQSLIGAGGGGEGETITEQINDKVSNTTFNLVLANTNSYISTKLNTTTFNSALANTNLSIATKMSVANTNSALALKANLSGATFTNNVTILRTGATDPYLIISGDSTRNRGLALKSGDSNRWILVADTSAESGSNAGSNLGLYRYSDTGSFLGTALTVNRSTGVVNFPSGISNNNVPVTSFPSGTAMLFVQTSAPTGWTKSTTHNDKALRIVSGTASSGGSSAFSTVFGKTATDGHSLTSAQQANMNVNAGFTTVWGGAADNPGTKLNGGAFSSPSVFATNGGTGYTILSIDTITQGGGATGNSHTHNIDLRVHYVDAIIAIKD